MYDRILVPLDGGPRGDVALTAAARLADRWSADLEALGLTETRGNLTRTEEAVRRQTAHVGTRADVSVQVATDTLSDEIARAIESTPATLVVMATSARSRSAALIESVADAVLRNIHGPALMIGPGATIPPEWPSGPMLICADGSDFSEEVLPHAATIADGLDLDPWMIAVNEPVAVPAAASDGIETNYTARLAGRLKPMVEREVNFDVLHGTRAAAEIVDYARVNSAAMIAMATHGRSGLRRLALGSVAMQVVHDAPCPVLLARPYVG